MDKVLFLNVYFCGRQMHELGKVVCPASCMVAINPESLSSIHLSWICERYQSLCSARCNELPFVVLKGTCMPFSELLFESGELQYESGIQRGDLDQNVHKRRRKGVSSV